VAYITQILIGRPEGNRRLGRPGRRWEDNIRMDLREIEWEGVEWLTTPHRIKQLVTKCYTGLRVNGKVILVKLTTHLHLVPRSRMRGAIPPPPSTPSWRCAQLKAQVLREIR
jgi:hypothetical protein